MQSRYTTYVFVQNGHMPKVKEKKSNIHKMEGCGDNRP